MRRLLMLAAAGIIGTALFFPASAWADTYAGAPGQTPGVGAVEQGAPTAVAGQPVQVLGEHFVRTPTEVLAFSGADIAGLVGIALMSIAAGTVLVRVRRGRQPQLA